MIVALTGICSKLGEALLHKLQENSAITKIIGIDCVEFKGDSHKVVFNQLDIRDKTAINQALAGVDVVIHLAFIVNPQHLPKREIIYSTNIDGSINVCEAAALNQVKKIIYLSSAAVYGYFPQNPPMVDEESPRLGKLNTSFYYPHTKGIVEEYLDTFESEQPQMNIVRLRAPLIVGPHFFAKAGVLKLKQLGKVALVTPLNHGGKVPFQIVHEEDLTDIIVMALGRDIHGAYNVAGDGILDLKNFFVHNWQIKVQEIPSILVKFVNALSRIFAKCHWSKCQLYPSLLANEKIKRDFNWTPKYSAERWLAIEPSPTGSQNVS